MVEEVKNKISVGIVLVLTYFFLMAVLRIKNPLLYYIPKFSQFITLYPSKGFLLFFIILPSLLFGVLFAISAFMLLKRKKNSRIFAIILLVAFIVYKTIEYLLYSSYELPANLMNLIISVIIPIAIIIYFSLSKKIKEFEKNNEKGRLIKKEKGEIPTGIIIVSVLLFLAAIGVLGLFALAVFIGHSFAGTGISLKGYLFIFLPPIVFVISAIGLLKGKKWARIMSMIVSILVILFLVSSVVVSRLAGNSFTQTIFGMEWIAMIGAAYIIGYLLSSKKAKEFFKK